MCTETFWSGLLATLSGQNYDGAALVYVLCALVDVPSAGVVDNTEYFRLDMCQTQIVKNLNIDLDWFKFSLRA